MTAWTPTADFDGGTPPGPASPAGRVLEEAHVHDLGHDHMPSPIDGSARTRSRPPQRGRRPALSLLLGLARSLDGDHDVEV